MKALLTLLETNDSSTPLLARLTLGLVMFPHGAQKALGLFGGYGFSGTMNFFTGQLHIPALFAFLAIAAVLVMHGDDDQRSYGHYHRAVCACRTRSLSCIGQGLSHHRERFCNRRRHDPDGVRAEREFMTITLPRIIDSSSKIPSIH